MTTAPAWPSLVDPAGPLEDSAPEAPDEEWADYVRNGGTESSGTYAPAARAFREAIGEILAGRARPDASFHRLACRLRVVAPVPHDPSRPPVVTGAPSLDQLLRIAVDFAPAAAGWAPELWFGPWVDELDVRIPAHRRALRMATAASSLVPTYGEPAPAALWLRRKPRPARAEREGVQALLRAPPSVWRLEERVGARWVLSDLLALQPRWIPDAPVTLVRPSTLSSVAPAVGDLLLARVMCTRSEPHPQAEARRWIACAAFTVPASSVSLDALTAALRLELFRTRLAQRGITLEELLRRRGHALVRLAHEGAWRRA